MKSNSNIMQVIFKFRIFLLTVVLIVLHPMTMNADVRVVGEVRDNLTGEDLPFSTIRVLQAGDSAVVKIINAGLYHTTEDGSKIAISQFSIYLPNGKDYIFETSHQGYDRKYTDVSLSKLPKKEDFFKLGPIYMNYASAKNLNEVVVVASKVKFYHKGDTLVYNADAFKLPEGSMLDALISQLPGVELTDGGEIYVNGKKVESLLLNGRKFFDNNRQLILQNLGSYAVKNVSVYNKLGMKSELAGTDMGDSEYVMDVLLKKEYMVGVNINLEAGYGSSGRYLGRLFAMSFTKNNQYGLYFNSNNLNESRKPGQYSSWTPEEMPSGVRETIGAGFDYNLKPEGNHWELNGNVEVNHVKENDGTDVKRENYLLDRNTFTSNFYRKNNKSLAVSTHHKMYYKNGGYGISLEPDFKYNRWENNSSDVEATFSENFNDVTTDFITDIYSGNYQDALKAMINRKIEKDRLKGWGLKTGSSLWQGLKLPGTSNLLELNIKGDYQKRHDERFNRFDINFDDNQNGGIHANRYYSNYPDFKSNIGGDLSYATKFTSNLSMTFKYKFNHHFAKENSTLYDITDDSDDPLFGILPSETHLGRYIDVDNSFTSRHSENKHTAEVQLNYRKGPYSIRYDLPVVFKSDRFAYHRGEIVDTVINRNTVLLDFGTQTMNWAKDSHDVLWEWSLKSQSPDLLNLVDFTDATNPLYVTEGARNLKNSMKFDTYLQYSNMNDNTGTHIGVAGHYFVIGNALARAITYDDATGVQTSRMYNVNGNWGADGVFSAAWMATRFLRVGTRTQYTHIKSEDLVGQGSQALFHSKVFQNSISEDIQAQCILGSQMLGLQFKGSYDRFTGNSSDFKKQNTWTFKTTLTGEFELPYNFSLTTDFSMYNRRGFTDNVLNTDNFIWNARLSYKALKGKLLLMLDGYDILHNLSNVSYTMNAQARTETLRTVLPRYVMFHVQWRFNYKPTPASKRRKK